MLPAILMIVALILMVVSLFVDPPSKLQTVAFCFMLASFVAGQWGQTGI